MKDKKNATIYVVRNESSGKTYINFECVVQLNSGKVVRFQFWPKFANPKFVALLQHQLDEECK